MKTEEIRNKKNVNKKNTVNKKKVNKKETIIEKMSKAFTQTLNKEKVDNSKKSYKKNNQTKTSKAVNKSNTKTDAKPASKNTSKSKSLNKTTLAKSSGKTVSQKTASTKKSSKNEKSIEIVEYYDLPYRYNETVVKILYQTPNTLFVYWDISDKDRENYIKQYGENFFNITRPVLIIHNETMNYSFEVPINDFANSWYLQVNDSKCNYRIELGRRPNYYNEDIAKEINENIHTDYIYVSKSNKIESPNDHVLFKTNNNNMIKFKNIKNQEEKSISIFDIVKKLPETNKSTDIPYISEKVLQKIYSSIYQNEDISFFDKISNPSSGNSSSQNIHSRT